MDKNNGGPAFPSHGSMGEVVQDGMTVLDFFAAHAAVSWQDAVNAGLNAGGKAMTGPEVAELLAYMKYQVANAMLRAREFT